MPHSRAAAFARKRGSLLAGILVAALPCTAHATSAQSTILVLGITGGEGVPTQSLTTIQEALMTSLSTAGHLDVVAASEVTRMVNLEAKKQLAGCTETQCAMEIAGALGASFVALPHVGRLGTVIVLNVNVIDTRSAAMLVRANERFEKESEIPEAADRLAIEVARQLAVHRGDTAAAARFDPSLQDKGHMYFQPSGLWTLPISRGFDVGVGGGWNKYWELGAGYAGVWDGYGDYTYVAQLTFSRVFRPDDPFHLMLGGGVLYANINGGGGAYANLQAYGVAVGVTPAVGWYPYSWFGVVAQLPIGYFVYSSKECSDTVHCVSFFPLLAALTVGAQFRLGL